MPPEPIRCFEPVLWMRPGETAETIAAQMSRCTGDPVSALRATLLENHAGSVRPRSLLYVGSRPLGSLTSRWLAQRQQLERACLLLPPAMRAIYWEVPSALAPAADFVEDAEQHRWLMGRNLGTAAALLATAADSSAGVWNHSLGSALAAARKVYADGVRTLGPAAFDRSSRTRLLRANAFLANHPAYRELQAALMRLPPLLRQRLGSLQTLPGRDGAWFRRQFAVPFEGRFPGASRVAHLLKADLVKTARVGGVAGLLIPAALAIPGIYQAPNGRERGRIATTQGAAILGGYTLGTIAFRFGVHAVAVAFFGPVGGFLVAAFVVGAVGWKAAEAIEAITGYAYDQLLPHQSSPTAVLPGFSGALR